MYLKGFFGYVLFNFLAFKLYHKNIEEINYSRRHKKELVQMKEFNKFYTKLRFKNRVNLYRTLASLSVGFILTTQSFVVHAEKSKMAAPSLYDVSSGQAITSMNQCDWPQVKKLNLGSEVKTYTFHFWKYAKEHLNEFSPNLNQLGSVVGDFHFDNVNIYYNHKNTKPQLSVADLDDAGEASLLADFIKYIVFLKTTYEKNIDLDFENILNAYINGIKEPNKVYEKNIPNKIEEMLKQDKAYFDRINEDYVLRKILKNQKKFEPQQNLNPISDIQANNKDILSQLKTFFNKLNINILDSGYSINTSGSSKDMLRFAFLAENIQKLNYFELKQTKCPGTELFQTQIKDQAKRYEKVLKDFDSLGYWEGTKFFNDINTQSKKSRTFILRLKQDNPLAQLEVAKNKNAQKVSEYFALYLGALHASTAKIDYINALKKSTKSLSKDISNFAENYLKQLSADLKKNN